MTQRSTSDGFLTDYCDGSFFKSHPLFSVCPHALQIIAYFDELEICNPLGSHSGIHKLHMYICAYDNQYLVGQIL